MKRIVTAVAIIGLLGGCSLLGKDKKPTTPTVGTRISVLGGEVSVEVDPALAGVSVTLPGATTNADSFEPVHCGSSQRVACQPPCVMRPRYGGCSTFPVSR